MNLISIYERPDRALVLHQLLEEREPEANISHKAMPSWEEHVRFVESKPYEAWYFIDTEFGPRKWLKSKTIYDIALINAFDIYASTVSYLACDPKSFDPMNGEVQLSDLKGAPDVDDFYRFFSFLTTKPKNVIWYFSAPHDISPFYEQHDEYKKLEHVEPTGTGTNPWTFNPKLEYDFIFRDGRVGNTSGTLSKLYETQQNVSLSSHRHIQLHTAISDALILAEFVMTRDLE